MINATIFSFYHSNNIGDLLIAEMVSDIFSQEYCCSYADIESFYSVDIRQWKSELCKTRTVQLKKHSNIKKAILSVDILRSTVNAVRAIYSVKPQRALDISQNSDLVIFAGGNSLMELGHFPASIKTLYKTVKLLKNNGKKVAFCFCGVGPFKTKASFKVLKKLLPLLDFISVRDNASYELVRTACSNAAPEIWRDPVLLKKIPKNNSNAMAIGMNVYFGHDRSKSQDMKKAFVALIRDLRQRCPDRKIYLFSSELTDIDNILTVKNEFSDDDMIEIKKIGSPNELFSFYDDVCCVLGVRMHTIITATISNKPVVSVSWQAKVTSLMEYLCQQELNFSMNDFIKAPTQVCNTFVNCISRKNEITQSNEKILLKTRDDIISSVKKFKERL